MTDLSAEDVIGLPVTEANIELLADDTAIIFRSGDKVIVVGSIEAFEQADRWEVDGFISEDGTKFNGVVKARRSP